MYIPDDFSEKNKERILNLIEENSFGTLVSVMDGIPFASHLPFLVEGGKLYGHMARSNPHWKSFKENAQVLVIFQGPHAYISPSWYLSFGVPTWNYAVIHAKGKPKIVEDESLLLKIVNELTQKYEEKNQSNWQFDIQKEYKNKLFSKIIGFEIDITIIEAKFKLSQNRQRVDQESVIEKLEMNNNGMAALMKQNLRN